MDISPITPPALRGAGLITPVATTPAGTVEQALSLQLPGVAPTTVDLSSSGRFLSLASLFQKKALDLQTSVLADADTSTALADAAVAAAAVAGAFDELQTAAVDSNGLPAGTLDGQSLQSQFFQQLGGEPEAAEADLAAIGLRFTPANGAASSLTVDDGVLQAAFRQDPGATSALLERAADAFLGVVGTQIQAQTANLSFLDDDSAADTGLPAVDLLPQQIAAAPDTAVAPQASLADNLFRQELVTENSRNQGTPTDADTVQLAAPPALADPGAPNDLPLPSVLILAAQAEAAAQAQRASSLPRETDARAPAINATLADVRQSALPIAATVTTAPLATGAPTQAAAPAARETLAVTPPVAPAQSADDRIPSIPAASTQAPPVPQAPDTPETTPEARPVTSPGNATSVAQQTRMLAQQLEAERLAARELDEKIAGASDAVRAALADEIARRDVLRGDQRELEATPAQRSADAPGQGATVPVRAAPDLLVRAAGPRPSLTTAEPASAIRTTAPDLPAQPASVSAPEQALQAARDPAIAAAIAAYHVNTGPFAAQNLKPDLQPPKAKPVAPVAAVTKVDAASAAGTPGDGSAPLR